MVAIYTPKSPVAVACTLRNTVFVNGKKKKKKWMFEILTNLGISMFRVTAAQFVTVLH